MHNKLGYIGKHRDIVEQILNMCDELISFINQTKDLLRKTDEIREGTYSKLLNNTESELQ